MNYQGFKVFVADKKDYYEVFCASEKLTKSILMSIDLASKKTNQQSPKVLDESSMTRISMSKTMAKYAKLEINDVILKQSSFVFWHIRSSVDDHGSSKVDSHHQSYSKMLMYQLTSTNHWRPGYVVIQKGHICCYTDSTKQNLVFFAFVCNNYCKGCRRLCTPDDINRPYVIELTATTNNRLETIFLAASSESDVTSCMQALFASINLVIPDNHGHLDADSNFEKFCRAVLTEDSLFCVIQDALDPTFSVLGYINVSDIVAAYSGDSEQSTNFCYLLLELDAAESTSLNASNEWILYFVSILERDRFIRSLSSCWEKLFQVSLPVVPITDEAAESLSVDIISVTGCIQRLDEWHANGAAILAE
jgi:hypothetical protein